MSARKGFPGALASDEATCFVRHVLECAGIESEEARRRPRVVQLVAAIALLNIGLAHALEGLPLPKYEWLMPAKAKPKKRGRR